jgi:hypothetical protein
MNLDPSFRHGKILKKDCVNTGKGSGKALDARILWLPFRQPDWYELRGRQFICKSNLRLKTSSVSALNVLLTDYDSATFWVAVFVSGVLTSPNFL